MTSQDPGDFELKGSCFCGAVTYNVKGNPSVRAYCHCTICQRLTGCPFIHTIHFPADVFTWTHVTPATKSFQDVPGLVPYNPPQKPHKTRISCSKCGVYVASYNSKRDTWSVWGAHLQRGEDGRILDEVWKRVKPTAHIFYGTRMLDIPDGLGKWEAYQEQSPRIAEQ